MRDPNTNAGTGGQPTPASTIANWRISYAASPPNAGFRTRRKSYLISPVGMIPEPMVSVADLLSDDRRDARVGLLGDPRAACAYDAAANHQALATGALSPCCGRAAVPSASPMQHPRRLRWPPATVIVEPDRAIPPIPCPRSLARKTPDQISRSRQSGIGVLAPCRVAISAGSGST